MFIYTKNPFTKYAIIVVDEMYAAIDEPNQSVYTSGSETYAQIRPVREPLPSNVITTQSIVHVENLSPNPQAHHAHSLNNIKNAHSRQGKILQLHIKGNLMNIVFSFIYILFSLLYI